MTASPLFCIRLTTDERALLKSLAEREHLSEADMFRRALRWYGDNVEPGKVRTPRARGKQVSERRPQGKCPVKVRDLTTEEWARSGETYPDAIIVGGEQKAKP